MECPYNLARNRQTRMLADLSIVGCYNSTLSKSDRDRLMLASAKHNLQFMPFFMLTEYQKVCDKFKYYNTQFIFIISIIIRKFITSAIIFYNTHHAKTFLYQLCKIIII